MAMTFAQGAFGKLYRGTYNGEDVAIKLLERSENDPERAKQMEQQFFQEVMILTNLRHPVVERLMGACQKAVCFAEACSETGPGCCEGDGLYSYMHQLGFIRRDLKSDNLFIVADFGVAKIEVQIEGMTPEKGTYCSMSLEYDTSSTIIVIEYKHIVPSLSLLEI